MQTLAETSHRDAACVNAEVIICASASELNTVEHFQTSSTGRPNGH